MAQKRKFYVVWEGREIGVFRSWLDCEAQIKNFPKAKYKSFETEEEALRPSRTDMRIMSHIGPT